MRPPYRSLGLLLAALLPAAAAAQEETPSFFEQLEVSVVNVEVFVTDGKGVPVLGLGPEDFEVLEDGKPVALTNFYAETRTDRVREQLAAGLPETAPAAPAAPPPPADQQLNLVVYVDHFNLRPQSRKRVLDGLRPFLENRLHQGDRVMLVGHGRALEVVEPFTADYRRLHEGLDRMGRAAAYRQIDDRRRAETMRLMNTAAAEGDDVLAYTYLRTYVQAVREDVRISAEALNQVVRSLAGMPGRKAVIYVSEGLPQRPGEELYQHLLDLFGNSLTSSAAARAAGVDPYIEPLREDQNHLFDAIGRAANAHQVTFYPLDATGSGPPASIAADRAAVNALSGDRVAMDALRAMQLQEPLIEMAAATGGVPVLNTFAFENVLGRLAGAFDAFYSLGFRPSGGGDGKYHKIEVRVKQPGLRARHRSGYIDKQPVERAGDRILASLLYDLEKNPLGVRLDFGTPQAGRGNRRQVPFIVRVPLREVTLVPQAGQEEGRLRFFLMVQDEKGDISELHEHRYPLTVPAGQAAAARRQDVGYSATLELRPGVAKVALGVLDEISGTESFILKRVPAGPAGRSR